MISPCCNFIFRLTMNGPYNLDSPTLLQTPPRIGDLDHWLEEEVRLELPEEEQSIVSLLIPKIMSMVRFPEVSLLLWPGCDRVRPEGTRQRVHTYPDELKVKLKAKGVPFDTRSNGPAIASFLYAGGERPARVGNKNAWSIHHLYSGKFPFCGRKDTLHAVKHGAHFTQSAGLVAAHPVLDAMCDEYPCITWYLRARAFERFGYDPDHAFTPRPDENAALGADSVMVPQSKGCQQLSPETATQRTWNLRDDNHQHFAGTIPIDQQEITLTLNWKADAASPTCEVGRYRIHLPTLVKEGLARQSDRGFVLRFQRMGNIIAIAINAGSPALKVGVKSW